MAARKCGKKLRAGGRPAEGKLVGNGNKGGEGIGKGRNPGTSTRQTRATAKETADRINGAITPPEMKQTRENAKPGRGQKVAWVGKGLKDSEDDSEIYSRLEKSQSRACTRSERPLSRHSGVISAEVGRAEDLDIKGECMPSVADWHWTKIQETALLEALSMIKPGVNFWRLLAERVPGRSADECFKKFQSGRTTTRAAKRSHMEELCSAPAERNGFKRAVSVRGNVQTQGRETAAIGRAATGPANRESRLSVRGRDAGASVGQTVARLQGAKRRRIEGPSHSPDMKLKRDTKPKVFQKDKLVKLSQRATRGAKQRTGKQHLVKSSQVRTSSPGVTLASGFDPAIASDVDNEIESSSAGADAVDNDELWTKAQDAALQDAYSTTRPSANFWHLISRRVPGRSAEECFNKFYAGHPTPPRVVQRSSLREVGCPPTLPNPPKAKPTGNRRLEAHRTVRNILRRQQVDDEDYKADVFAAFEPPDVVHSVMEMANDDESATFYETDMEFCVDAPLPGSTKNSTTKCAQSNKENWKPNAVGQSREFGASLSQVFSPEILKKVKDPLLMDKYIDHLHQRRTRRPGLKSAQKNAAKRVSRLHDLCKDGFDTGEVRLDAIYRAKQELRDVFLRPGSVVEEPVLDLLGDSIDFEEDEDYDEERMSQ